MYQFCTKAIDIPPQDKDSYPFLLDPLFFATPPTFIKHLKSHRFLLLFGDLIKHLFESL